MTYSYTRLAAYSVCPFAFKWKHIQKVIVDENFFLRSGRAGHDIICDYTNACYQAGKTHLFEEWESIAAVSFRKHNLDATEEAELTEVIHEFVSSRELELEGLAGVEKRVSLDKNLKPCEWNKGWIRGKIDKLYLDSENCRVTDYKLGFNLRPDKFQLEFYLWMISKLFPHIKYFQGEFDLIRFQTQQLITMTAKDLQKVEQRILSLIHSIEIDKKMEPRINSKCGECLYWKLCPAKKKHILRVPRSKDEAEKLLAQILIREKENDEYRKALKSYVEKKGAVLMNDMQAQIKGIVKLNWDLNKVLTWAKQRKILFSEVIKVNGDAMKKQIEDRLGPGKYPRDMVDLRYSLRFDINKIQPKKKSRK